MAMAQGLGLLLLTGLVHVFQCLHLLYALRTVFRDFKCIILLGNRSAEFLMLNLSSRTWSVDILTIITIWILMCHSLGID